MKTSDMPSSSTSESSSSRISAWIVTSSAVVGSSAISRRGRHASAIAIATRWRWPPESWCGYRADDPLRDRAARRARPRRSRGPRHPVSTRPRGCGSTRRSAGRPCGSGSAPCAAPGTRCRSRRRAARASSRSGRPISSRPFQRTLPAAVAPSGSSPRIASAVSDLPDPDSPISPTRAPSGTANETPSTTRRPSMSTVRSCTSRLTTTTSGTCRIAPRGRMQGVPAARQRRVGRLAQRVAEQVEPEHRERDREAGPDAPTAGRR